MARHSANRPNAIHGPEAILEVVAALIEQGCEVAITRTRARDKWRVTVTDVPEGVDAAPLLAYTVLRLSPERQAAFDALLAELAAMSEAVERSRDYAAYSRQEDAWFDRLTAFCDATEPGVQPGKLMMWGVGDGKAVYVVTEVHPRRVQLQHIPIGDRWQWPGVDEDGCISPEEAEKAALRADTPLFGSLPRRGQAEAA